MSKNLSLVKNSFEELPNNIEAEQSVLGSILLSNEIFDDVNTIISSSNFYDPIHQKSNPFWSPQGFGPGRGEGWGVFCTLDWFSCFLVYWCGQLPGLPRL